MPAASYYNLNKTYIFTTVLIVFAIVMYLLRSHARVHYKLVDTNNSTCNDPVAMYFNKKLGRKCYVDRMSHINNYVTGDVTTILGGITSAMDTLTNNMQGLTRKYDDRMTAAREAEQQLLANKQAAIGDLVDVVNKIKDLSAETTGGIQALKYEYMVKLKANVKNLTGIANTIVQKLTSSVYTPNYKYTRAKYANGYDKIRKYLNRLIKDEIIVPEDVKDNNGDLMMNLTDEARKGKKM